MAVKRTAYTTYICDGCSKEVKKAERALSPEKWSTVEYRVSQETYLCRNNVQYVKLLLCQECLKKVDSTLDDMMDNKQKGFE